MSVVAWTQGMSCHAHLSSGVQVHTTDCGLVIVGYIGVAGHATSQLKEHVW